MPDLLRLNQNEISLSECENRLVKSVGKITLTCKVLNVFISKTAKIK